MSKRGPRFSEREKLATLKEGEKNSVKAVCAKYGISDQSYRLWRYKVKGIQPRKPFSIKKKREILEGKRLSIHTCSSCGFFAGLSG